MFKSFFESLDKFLFDDPTAARNRQLLRVRAFNCLGRPVVPQPVGVTTGLHQKLTAAKNGVSLDKGGVILEKPSDYLFAQKSFADEVPDVNYCIGPDSQETDERQWRTNGTHGDVVTYPRRSVWRDILDALPYAIADVIRTLVLLAAMIAVTFFVGLRLQDVHDHHGEFRPMTTIVEEFVDLVDQANPGSDIRSGLIYRAYRWGVEVVDRIMTPREAEAAELASERDLRSQIIDELKRNVTVEAVIVKDFNQSSSAFARTRMRNSVWERLDVYQDVVAHDNKVLICDPNHDAIIDGRALLSPGRYFIARIDELENGDSEGFSSLRWLLAVHTPGKRGVRVGTDPMGYLRDVSGQNKHFDHYTVRVFIASTFFRMPNLVKNAIPEGENCFVIDSEIVNLDYLPIGWVEFSVDVFAGNG